MTGRARLTLPYNMNWILFIIGVVIYLAMVGVWMWLAMKNAPEMVDPEDEKLLNELKKHD